MGLRRARNVELGAEVIYLPSMAEDALRGKFWGWLDGQEGGVAFVGEDSEHTRPVLGALVFTLQHHGQTQGRGSPAEGSGQTHHSD
jgi:hypothetical protein